MFSARSFKVRRLLPVLAVLCGCADPRGSYEDFVARADRVSGDAATGGAGSCRPPEPGTVSGTALMAIGTTISPGHPILFYGEIETPERDGETTVVFRYHPLAASDRRTEVGEELVLGPFPIESDGRFSAPIGEMTLPGEANALLPGVPITSALTLSGSICGISDFYCGIVTGYSTFPVEGPIEGDFGLSLLEGEVPAQPRYGCAEDQLAAPL